MKNISFKLLLILCLGLYSCRQQKSNLESVTLKSTQEKKDSIEVGKKHYENASIGSKTDSIPDISGEYELVKGRTLYKHSTSVEVYKAGLIIERLSKTDFGFYYVEKVKELSPTGSFGILRNFKNEFYEIGICEAIFKNYLKDTLPSGIYLRNKFGMIKKEKDVLGIITHFSNARGYSIYKKKEPQKDFYISLIKTLKNKRLLYEKYLLRYEIAKKVDTSQLKINYIFKDSIWQTVHEHIYKNPRKSEIITFKGYHSYINETIHNSWFVKEDSIFFCKLENMAAITDQKIKK